MRDAEFVLEGSPEPGVSFSGLHADERLGSLVRFRTGGGQTIARFAGYVDSPLVAHEILEWRSREAILVVSYGQAYLCSVAGGALVAKELDVRPATSLALAPDGAVVIADFTCLHKFAPDGSREWISDRVSYDGIQALAIHGDRCALEGWDAPGRRFVPVEVDLTTGRATGSPHHSAR